MKAGMFFLLLLLPLCLFSQSRTCTEYKRMIKKADKALRKQDHRTALLQLLTAREKCPDQSARTEQRLQHVLDIIESKRLSARQGQDPSPGDLAHWQTIHAVYLAHEAQWAFAHGDIRLAWLLTQAALRENPDNEQARGLQQKLPGYGADHTWRTDGENDSIHDFSVSPDSAHLSYLTQENDGSYLLNVLALDDSSLRTFPIHSLDSYRAHFSPDGRYLAFVSKLKDGQGTLKVLALDGDRPPLSFEVNDAKNRLPRYSPDGRRLTFFTQISGRQGTLNVLELDGKAAPRTFTDSDIDSYSARYSPDGQYLIFFTEVADRQGTLNILDLERDSAPLAFPNSDTYSPQYSPDGRYLTFFTQMTDWSIGTLHVLKLGNSTPLLSVADSYNRRYRYSPDGRYLSFFTDLAGDKGVLNVLQLDAEPAPRTFADADLYLNSDSYRYPFSPDSRHLLFFTGVTEGKGTLNVLELGKNEAPRTFANADRYSDRDSDDDAYSFQYSPDGRHLAFFTEVSGDTGALNVLDLSGDRPPLRFPGVDNYRDDDCMNCSFPFSRDGNYLMFLTDVAGQIKGKGTLHVLELKGDQQLRSFTDSYAYLHSEVDGYPFSPDNRHLVFYTQLTEEQGTLNVLELGNNQPPRTFPGSYRYSYGDRYSPDGRYLVFYTQVANGKGTLNLLELPAHQPPRTFTDQYRNTYRYSYNYSPDGRYLAFLAADRKTLQVYDLQKAKHLQHINNQYTVEEGLILNHHLLIASRHPDTQQNIYKTGKLNNMGEGYWPYLIQERYAPLTAEEKRVYRILE